MGEFYNIKKHLSICNYEQLWKKLTIICGFAIYIIIKGSSIPMIFDNAFFRVLLYSNPDGDKTLYNIAISIVAAYVFYILQIYLNERDNTKRALTVTALDTYNLVHQIQIFLFVWDNLTEKTSDGVITCKKEDSFYYKGILYPKVYDGNAEELKLTEGRILEVYSKIIQNREFQRVDTAIYRLFTQIDLGDKITQLRMAMIGAGKSSEHCATFFESYSPKTVEDIEKTVEIICALYGFANVDNFSITTDQNEIERWKRYIEYEKEIIMKNSDFFNSLPDEYAHSLK